MSTVELALLGAMILGAGVIALGVAMRSRAGQRISGSGETPSLPAKPQPPARPSHTIVHIRPGAALTEQLRHHADEAERTGLRPFLEFGAVWCPPSRMFGDALEDPRMQAALAGVYLIRAELDDFANDPLVRELRARVVPAFYELAAEGRWTGRQINGGAWGVDTIDNMSRTMSGFFGG